jgi:putative inorganic carbon (HCO3(-)) transporter
MNTGLGTYLPIIVYLGIVVAIGASIIWRPIAGLFVLAILMPNQTLRYKLHGMPLGAQIIDLLMLGVIVGLVARQKQVMPAIPMRAIFVLLATYTYISLWLGSFMNSLPWPTWFDVERLSLWKNTIRIPFLMFLAYGATETVADVGLLVFAMCLGIGLVDRGYFLSLRGRSFTTFSYAIRDAGPTSGAGENGLAALLAQTSLFLLGFSACLRSWKKFTVVGLSALSIIGLALTFSRGGYVGFLVGFLYLAFFVNRKWILIAVAGGALLMIAPEIVLPHAVIERIQMTEDQDGRLDSSSLGRIKMWQRATDLWLSQPLTGVGYNTFWYLTPDDDLHDTHNFYLKLLCEQGVIGLGLFLFMIGKGWSLSRQLALAGPGETEVGLGMGACSCMVCLVVVNIFGDRFAYMEISGYTFLMLGMVQRALLMADRQPAGEGQLKEALEVSQVCA